MPDFNIILPSKPAVISEEEFLGVYEIDGLYPGYGHTLGNSLRRIILSSLPGFSITTIKIDGVSHEFSTINGVKEDVITIILNLKRVRFKVTGDEPQTVYLKAKGVKEVKAGDIEVPGQVEVMNKDQIIANLTEKNVSLDIEITLEKGLGYMPKEVLKKDKAEIGSITLDAIFTPIRRVSYEVEQMRVGDRTDYNKLRLALETDGTISPREALERSIQIMIAQLKAVVGFVEDEEEISESDNSADFTDSVSSTGENQVGDEDFLKTRIEELDLSSRTQKALAGASIRTVGGLIRKKEADLEEIDGLGGKGINEIKSALSNLGIVLK
ncbi:MAG: DNA-directed RNA polymerase subunit alpha [Candidatus Woesebacteria bacterium GW2011_GWA1_39_21b]|uniref:DNA-directed RNA polymerase subunit alpha n=3 Tax=Patescibacteria group TaxID=1783273 RepID=A0A1G2QFK6_9BACT|nr:MAG: DNA-directed RNA polymerase subunit alpha [Candidatus Woesebacteria bacterium GW2011_GWA1_39_21b]KKS77203.1 MAG: DNA-directed RNA polymerase subunit alpha [Parcubacteria group bacterium GW2011_GWB1_42_9]KKS89776.1 MAG: DNA-directed RNA polymerase subunit alpha [Parcubacteria group bacterium GW2011_GWC1_43_11b]OHA59346.1 MAG: DNA-directed RNA polymerase subunit alpha [Candidatus Vogelbacteria bacterium RIFOXYB1_FULL_42_16]OHA60269.1 MAG: DNA-directed RNA polymerase subunit alpha [Candida